MIRQYAVILLLNNFLLFCIQNGFSKIKSDEGDTSDSSSQDDRRERGDGDAKRDVDENCLYLSVPPPSPILPRAKGNGKMRRAAKKRIVEKNPPVTKKILVIEINVRLKIV